MRKNINKKIFLMALLTFCSITLVWTGAAMAKDKKPEKKHTKITNKTQYRASGEVKYATGCTSVDYRYENLEKGAYNQRDRGHYCKISKITATLYDGSKNTPCTAYSTTCNHENFRIQGDMSHCEVQRD